jgi:tRNA(His) guanylyltransferase
VKTSDRMKVFERASETVLESKKPVCVRLDGNGFSKFTKKYFQKPFDPIFEAAMSHTTKEVADFCNGVVLAYTQSDEITLVMQNDKRAVTDPFLGNRSQKLASLLAAKASLSFNDYLRQVEFDLDGSYNAMFDCRAFTVRTWEDVQEMLEWRQKDCLRNAISGICTHDLRKTMGRKTAQKALHGLGRSAQKDLYTKHLGKDIEDEYSEEVLYGVTWVKENYEAFKKDLMPPEVFQKLLESKRILDPEETVIRSSWKAKNVRYKNNPDFLQRLVDAYRQTP